MNLIGLYGVARSGKDEVGKALVAEGYYRYAFAEPIRKAASAMFGLPVETFEGDNPNREVKNEFWGLSPREMLQLLGTEGGRNVFGQELWVKRAEMRWNGIKAMRYMDEQKMVEFVSPGLVVTDVRFDNEAWWIRRNGGFVVRIVRPGVGAINKHVSEQGIRQELITHTIVNDGTLDDLHRKAAYLMEVINRRS